MENASEALIMAFSVLIFVLALSISISSFSQARLAVDSIVSEKEIDESFIKDSDGNYLNYINFNIANGGTRTVGVDTVVDSMYRAYKENYKIYFYNIPSTAKCGLSSFIDDSGEKVYYIDLENEVYANLDAAYKHLDEVLLQNSNSFYKYLSKSSFTEKLGEYYQEDENSISDIAEVNKTKKRVIVYIVK